jgi:hypothetical protein
MKALIVEISDKYVILLKNNGEFVKIPRVYCTGESELKAGCEVDSSPWERNIEKAKKDALRIAARKVASIAAIFLLVLCIYWGVDSYYRPYTYISIDINPSVEIVTNIFDRIINIRGINDDGKKIVSLKEYRNRSVNEGIENIIGSAIETGYIKQNYENVVLLTILSKDPDEIIKIEEDIQKTIAEEISAAGMDTSIYNIEDAVLNCKIIRFILQPLVENSISHGLEKKPGYKQIIIDAYKKENFLILKVSDNGIGISPDRLNQLIKFIDEHDGKLIDNNNHLCLGLKNVHQRIRLFLGKPYGLKIFSALGKGTEIEITLPFNQES